MKHSTFSRFLETPQRQADEVGTFKMSVKIKLQSHIKIIAITPSLRCCLREIFPPHNNAREKPIEKSQTTDYFIYSAQ